MERRCQRTAAGVRVLLVPYARARSGAAVLTTTQAGLAAAIFFFALGATTFATIVLLLFAPRNLEVRAMALFGLGIAGWLVGEGIGAIAPGRVWMIVSLLSVTVLPALFIAMTAGDDARRLGRYAATVAVPCAVALVVSIAALQGIGPGPRIGGPVNMIWQIGAWTTGSVLLLRNSRHQEPARRRPRSARGLLYFLAIAAPLTITVAILFEVGWLLVHVLPLLVVAIYFGLFVGIARLQYYDIEVRAARSGDIAAGAAETSRLAALGEMAASFAHEVRNPLTGVRSLTQRLAEEEIDDEKRRRYTGVILEEMNRIERIVDDMLGVAKRASFPAVSSTVELDSLFRDIVLLTSSRARRVDLRVDADAGGLSVDTSREALAQTLLNLTLNAIAHSPAGGRVRLVAGREPDGIAIRVSDEGPGVPTAERERVFEPFYSSRPDGTGLGLSVVRRLARQAGWTVDIDDGAGGGAVFRITIPADAETTTARPGSQGAAG